MAAEEENSEGNKQSVTQEKRITTAVRGGKEWIRARIFGPRDVVHPTKTEEESLLQSQLIEKLLAAADAKRQAERERRSAAKQIHRGTGFQNQEAAVRAFDEENERRRQQRIASLKRKIAALESGEAQ